MSSTSRGLRLRWHARCVYDRYDERSAAASAAVYGVSFSATSATKVTITVAEEGQAAYTVAAELMPTGHAGNVTWKALLHPHKP